MIYGAYFYILKVILNPFNNGNMLLLFRRGPGGAGGGRKKLRRKALHETTTHLTKFNDFESENLA